MAKSTRSAAGAALLFAAAVISTIFAGILPAQAQLMSAQPSTIPGTNVEILPTPYVWIPWTSMNVTPNNASIPSASSTIDPYQLYSHLTWVPFMGEVEFRNGDFGLITDYIHAPLKSGVSTKGIVFTSANAGLTLDTGTAMFLYRPWSAPGQSLDLGFGVRGWGLDGGISVDRRVRAPVNVSTGESWVDPMLSIRYHAELGNGFSATAYGDVGGFGLGANVDWQVVGTIDYTWKPGLDLHFGVRALNFNFGASRADIAMHMYGPIAAATLHF